MSYTVTFGKLLRSRGLFFILLFFVFSFSFFTCEAQAQSRASFAFWNVENLFDTIPSPFYDDNEFTPEGERRWNTDRYETKLKNLAAVLVEIRADIVGLAEVENEEVVRGLVEAAGAEYNYIHRTSGDGRGIDLALLYKGDRFFPDADPRRTRLERSGTGREFLHVEGELSGWRGEDGEPEHIHLIVCHLSSNLNTSEYRRRNLGYLRKLLETILSGDPAASVVVMGDMNSTPGDKDVRKILGGIESPYDFVHSPHVTDHKMGRGSYNFRGRWYLYDWMMVSPSIARGRRIEAGVWARERLTETVQGVKRPRGTFFGGEYRGGASDHFPVWMVVGK